MELNLIGTLTMYKMMKILPNFSELGRIFGKDRHTIKNMFEGKEVTIRKKKGSELDQYKNEIIDVLSKPGIKIKAAFWYFKNEKKLKCSYDNFKHYASKNKLIEEARTGVPHPLFETDPGKQLQVDWVESIKLTTKYGEVLEFNLFSATLGYSRLHYFEYTEFKQESDFKRCLVHYFKKIGGLPKEVLTDNMAAIVNVTSEKKNIHPSIIQFFKDLDIKLKLCRVRTPQTKGKDEVSNKYAQRLMAYDGKIENKEHLLKLIEKLNVDINRQVNTRTNVPPILLFSKEKEYLKPLPNPKLLDSYEDEMRSCKVPSTFVIEYKGAKYSVPPYLITKTVKYKEERGKLLVYYNSDLVAEHQLTKPKTINYNYFHYKSGLEHKLKQDDDIDKLTAENLAKFKDFGENYE